MGGMHVGVCKLILRLPENDDLKGKRRALQSLTSRVKTKFNVAVAEVEEMDSWRTIVLGISCVSNDGRHVDSMLSTVVRYIARSRGDLEVVGYEIEVMEGV
jgi:uncharacterized protein YlxP (DUF503 family)